MTTSSTHSGPSCLAAGRSAGRVGMPARNAPPSASAAPAAAPLLWSSIAVLADVVPAADLLLLPSIVVAA